MTWRTRWLVLLGTWLIVAGFSCAQIWVARAALGDAPPLWPLLRMEVPVWMFWVGATIGIVLLARRVPLDRTRALSSVAVHFASAIVTATLFVSFKVLWYQAFNPYPFTDPDVSRWFWRGFREWFILGFVIYWAVVGVYHAFTNYARFRSREAELAAVTLRALQAQLRPHFLFNALNTVSGVLESDPRGARRVLGHLGDLLRASLATHADDQVTLARELELLRAYLAIEQARFAERLVVRVDADPRLERALVPGFLLQPLVENALRHGIGPREEGGTVAIDIHEAEGALVIDVDDDGVGARFPLAREGIGLGNTVRRIRALYGAAAQVDVGPSRLGGFAVHLRLPLQGAQP